MTIERTIRLIAGTLVLTGLILSLTINHWWLLLTAFVGLNFFQYGITDFCPMAKVLEALGMPHARNHSMMSR